MLPAGLRRRRAAAAAAAATVLALAVLFVLWHRRAGGAPPLAVPDVPGALQAREWLLSYYAERKQRGSMPRWPPAVALPSCEVKVAAAAEREVAGEGPSEQQPEQQLDQRHLVLATVGDRWWPDAGRNRWGALPCERCLSLGRAASTCPARLSHACLPLLPLHLPRSPAISGGWTIRALQILIS